MGLVRHLGKIRTSNIYATSTANDQFSDSSKLNVLMKHLDYSSNVHLLNCLP